MLYQLSYTPPEPGARSIAARQNEGKGCDAITPLQTRE